MGSNSFSGPAAEAKVVAAELTCTRTAKPIVIGAWLSGIASLLAEGASERDSDPLSVKMVVPIQRLPRHSICRVTMIRPFSTQNRSDWDRLC